MTFLTRASSITSQAKVKRRNKPNVEVLMARLTVECHKLLNKRQQQQQTNTLFHISLLHDSKKRYLYGWLH